MTDERPRFYVDVSGAKHVDPVTGNAYWWPDDPEDGAPAAPTGPLRPEDGWQEVGYVDADSLSFSGTVFVADAPPDANGNVFTREALANMRLADEATYGAHRSPDPDGIPLPRPHTTRMEGSSLVAEFAVAPDSEVWKLLTGDLAVSSAGSFSIGNRVSLGTHDTGHAVDMRVTDYEPDLPPAPVKGLPHVGKKYRQARRAHRRAVDAWKKAGRPMRPVERRYWFPRVALEPAMPRDTMLLAAEQRIAMTVLPPEHHSWALITGIT